MPEVILNLFPVRIKPRKLLLCRIKETYPQTPNRITRFRLAAKIAKSATEFYQILLNKKAWCNLL